MRKWLKKLQLLFDDYLEKINQGIVLSNEISESLIKIVLVIIKTGTIVGEIAVASNEQVSGLHK